MKDNAEEIPTEVFDWIQFYTFEELNKSQQEKVLLYFSEEEYRTFGRWQEEIKNEAGRFESTNKERIAARLGRVFDEKHNTKSRWMYQPVTFWKAAAVFIFFTTVFAFSYILKKPTGLTTNTREVVDTVYVKKEVTAGPEKIHDTVVIYKTRENKSNHQRRDPIVTGEDVIRLENDDDLDILPVSAFENEMNGPKNNSRKDDSITKNYKSIAL
jgi:hypothetical protein